MTFYSDFSDYKGKVYKIEITNSISGGDKNLVMGGNPCNIDSSSDGLFSPIKSRSASLEVMVKTAGNHLDTITEAWYSTLYEPTSRGTKVKIYEYDSSYPLGVKEVIFRGYLTPCQYDQTFTYLDSITLECVDAISTTKDYDWINDGKYHSFLDIILFILDDCGYQGRLYVPRSYNAINGSTYVYKNGIRYSLIDDNGRPINDILGFIEASSGNFVDDDEAHTPWKQYEVLEEMLKFLNWSLVPDGDNVWLVDYRAESKENGDIDYSVYDIPSKSYTSYRQSPSTTTNLNLNELTGGTTNLSLDDVYNRIEISDNLYKIDEIAPNIFEDGNHISVTDEIQEKAGVLPLNTTKWTKQETTGWWFWKDTKTTTTGWYYQTLCRLKKNSGWTHYFYHMNDLTDMPNNDGQGYYDPGSISVYISGPINKYINTHGCLMQHYAYLKETNENMLPATIDWTNVLTFFVMDDTIENNSGKVNIHNLKNYEKKVLEYNIDEEINWKPATGVSWLYIKGDLFYQYNGGKYGKKDRNTLNTVNLNKKYYITAPVDKLPEIPDDILCTLNRDPSDPLYGSGYQCWKFKLQIGEGSDAKYWAERFDSTLKRWVGYWTTTPSDFYISFNNSPDPDSDDDDTKNEHLPAFKWISCLNNNDFKDKVGVNGYSIPIDANDTEAPSKGKLKLTVYTPAVLPQDIQSYFEREWKDSYMAVNWYDLPNVIYAQNFELGYVYTNTNKWYNQHQDNTNTDKVYIGYIDDTYVNDFDNMQLKLNTANVDKPISRSYVFVSDGKYLQTLSHVSGDEAKVQEYNIVDAYLDHYSEPKPIFEANIHNLVSPISHFTKNQIAGDFLVDSQSFDVRRRNNRIKIISF